MKNYILTALLLMLIQFSFAQSLPIHEQPIIWLRADMYNNNPNQWDNCADTVYNANRSGVLLALDTCTLNYHQAFDFDTTTSPFTISNYYPAKRDKYNIFCVYQLDDTLLEYGLWQMQLDSATDIKLSSTKTKNIRKHIRYSKSGSNIPIINSSSHSWNRILIDSTISTLQLIGTDSFRFKGKFAEFMVFNRRLKRIENEKVHTYLALKYGIGIYYLNYVNSLDTILWDSKVDSIYMYDIVGLGRDDSLGVYQKQTAAKGGNSDLVMYFDSLKHLNIDNNSFIDNMNFALYGHNDDSINIFTADTNNMYGYQKMMKRKWKVKIKGNTISQKAFSIKMFAPNVDTNLTLKLVINRLADDDFNPAFCTEISPYNRDTLGYYYYNNIYWDTDFSGEDIFTFSQLPVSANSQRVAGSNNDTSNNESTEEEDMDANNQSLECNIYPNPSNGNFVLEIDAVNKTKFTLTIIDALGKVILKEQYGGSLNYRINKQIDNSGNYLIRLNAKAVNKSLKLLVK